MKNFIFQNMTVIAIIALLFCAACDHADNSENNGKYYVITGIVPSPGNTTTHLTITFDKDIPDLCADDIKINAAAFAANSTVPVSNVDFPVIKGPLKKTDTTHTYELAIIPGNSGRIKVGLDPYRGFIGWNAVDVTVHALFHFKGTTGLTITGYSGSGGDEVIPSDIDEIPVTTIGNATGSRTTEPTVLSYKQLTSVSIPDTVTAIGSYSFFNNQLTNVKIPENVTVIGVSAFANNHLTSITIPDKVTVIANGTFINNRLTSVTIHEKVTDIGVSAFANNQLNSVTIPEKVTIIENSAFANNQLDSVTIPDGVTEIRSGAFAYNQLSDVSIPASVATIGGSAFANNCLTGVTIPHSITGIGQYAFQNNLLTEINIPGSIRSLSGFNDNQLVSVVIPDVDPSDPHDPLRDVITIGVSAFANNKLTCVKISDSVSTIGQSAFQNNQLNKITIGNRVTSIGINAFANNQLIEITIGADVILGSGSFGSGFEYAYNVTYEMAAGTYTRTDTSSNVWVKQVVSD